METTDAHRGSHCWIPLPVVHAEGGRIKKDPAIPEKRELTLSHLPVDSVDGDVPDLRELLYCDRTVVCLDRADQTPRLDGFFAIEIHGSDSLLCVGSQRIRLFRVRMHGEKGRAGQSNP